MVYTRPKYTCGQDDVPTTTEECLCVRSKNRHEADRDERLANVPTTGIYYMLHYTLDSPSEYAVKCIQLRLIIVLGNSS
jgi:hypothetical protein